MQKDTNQTRVQEPRDDSGGYASSPQPQQPPVSSNTGQGMQGDGYQRYDQPYMQGSQQQPYWQRQLPYGAPPCCDAGPYELTSLGMRARTAGWLSYLLGWVTGLIFFLLEKENRFVRFHAMQSILFFGGLSILEAIIRFFETLFNYSMFPNFGLGLISSVVGLVWFICWIVLMVRASKGIYYKLPVIGDYADKLIDQIHV
ncbi:MAG TPA: DUF4870 domain-containing protein [Ktedonobacteraceae bacterium]